MSDDLVPDGVRRGTDERTEDPQKPQEVLILPPEGEADVEGFKDLLASILARVARERARGTAEQD